MKINEIYTSILGESTWAGVPCVIVRLCGCNMRCTYCDTTYAYEKGIEMSVGQVFRTINKYNLIPVLITGGEPLIQEESFDLINNLIDSGHIVLVETNGSISIENIPGDVITIMDIKCPASGESDRNLYSNIEYLSDPDNVKFVLSDRSDYEWAVNIIKDYDLESICFVLFSPVHGKLDPADLSQWIIDDKLLARVSLQLHKIIWGENSRMR